MIHINACDNAMTLDHENKNICFIWIGWDNKSLRSMDTRHSEMWTWDIEKYGYKTFFFFHLFLFQNHLSFSMWNVRYNGNFSNICNYPAQTFPLHSCHFQSVTLKVLFNLKNSQTICKMERELWMCVISVCFPLLSDVLSLPNRKWWDDFQVVRSQIVYWT